MQAKKKPQPEQAEPKEQREPKEQTKHYPFIPSEVSPAEARRLKETLRPEYHDKHKHIIEERLARWESAHAPKAEAEAEATEEVKEK